MRKIKVRNRTKFIVYVEFTQRLWQNKKSFSKGAAMMVKKIVVCLLGLMLALSFEWAKAQDFPDNPIKKVSLNASEEEWIAQHPVLKAGVLRTAHPYEYVEKDGSYRGLSSSYIKIIEDSTGLKFKVVPIDNWKDMQEKFNNGEIDILPLSARADVWNLGINYSNPYIASSLGIFASSSVAFVNNLDDVQNQKIAISGETKDHFKSLLNDQHHFVVFDNPEAAMRAVDNGELDFYIGDIMHSKVAINKLGLHKLRYVAPVVGSAYDFGVGVPVANRKLLEIVNKVFAQIDPQQHFDIRHKWTNEEFGNQELMKRFAQYILILLGIFAIILAGITYRHQVLRRRALQLSQSQKMESIGRLAGGVAHDFNNMLSGILGATEVLGRKLGADDPRQRYTNIIEGACEKAAYLISQLLVFSRDNERQFSYVNMKECVNEALSLLEHGLQKKYTIKEKFSAENYAVLGNCNLIQNIIINLGFNAKDAMSQGGVIEVVVKNVTLTREMIGDLLIHAKPGKYLEVSVKDEGCGIPEAIQGKIFEPFFTTKEVGKGTGLGLAAVYGIVRDHKGSIGFETSDKGTKFKIYLPLIRQQEAKMQEKTTSCGVNGKIMVVDDEPLLLEVLKEILKMLGAEVITVNDAREAVKVYQENSGIDVVMLDVVMPHQNGVQTYRQLREINTELKVVFMSGYNRDVDILNILEENPNVRFIGKPYKLEECEAVLNDILS